MKNTLKKSVKRILSVVAAAALLFLLLDLVFPVDTGIDFSGTLTDRDNNVIAATLNSSDKWRFRAELEELSPKLTDVTIFKEDRYFYYHPGINIFSLARAFFSNLFFGERTLGASTITMQTVRMLKPKERSYLNKFIEMFRALQLELHYSKDEILEMYFNLLPYGGNIEGAKTASILYLGINPAGMSLSQAAALSVIPQNPNKYRIGRYNSAIEKKKNLILNTLAGSSVFPQKEISGALAEPFHSSRKEIPNYAPHLLNRLAGEYPLKNAIHSKIDSRIQIEASSIIKNYIDNQKLNGIYNAAAIVIDNKTLDVLAYVGSNNFYDSRHSGQVDGIRAVRSPGSALKPLVYAMGFDDGMITPRRVILDVPINSSEYSPDNYSGSFRGEVTVEQSLIHSLNVPAVRVAMDIGCDNFIDRLCKAGFKTVEKKKKGLGLSVVLGGCGVTLEELAGMYSGFGNKGKIRNLRYTGDKKYDTNTVAVCSPEAAYMISDILMKSARPDVLYGYLSGKDMPIIAWKTGTSYGRRDAWSIGYNPRYTVGVWAGNFSGAASSELTGAKTATPLMFEIFRILGSAGNDKFIKPDGLYTRQVDQETGLLPGEYTTHTVDDLYIPLVSSSEISNNYSKIFVSMDETVSYCSDCLPEGNYKEKVYKRIPPDLASYYEKYSLNYEKIPAHNQECPRIFSGKPPVISYPVAGQEYLLQKSGDSRIMLQCFTANDVQDVYWYINDKFYTKARNDEKIFFRPNNKGKIKISCSDDMGRNSDIEINVSFY